MVAFQMQSLRAQKSRFPLAALPWMLIPYDSLTHLLGADLNATSQTLPLTALVAPMYLAVRGRDLRINTAAGRIGAWLCLAAMAMILVTCLNITYEAIFRISGDAQERMTTAVRQGVSLLMGIASFFMFADAGQRAGLHRCMRWTMLAGIPTLLLALAQVAQGIYRVQGFSSEPSHLADMMVLAMFPALLVANREAWRRWLWMLPAVGVLFLTFSTTGFVKAFFAIAAVFVARGQAFRFLAMLPATALVGYVALQAFEDNYVYHMLSFMYARYVETGELLGASFVDRFFGLAGPLSLLDQWHTWLGYGLGGDAVYFHQLFDPETAETIRAVKGDVVSIASLQGKILMYGGVWGYAIYASAWVCAWRLAPRGHLARIMLPATFAASLFSLGPLFLPYAWLWLAAASFPAQKASDREST